MKIHELDGMSKIDRRRLLKILSATAALPIATRLAASDVLMGSAHAQSANEPMYFIEINLRDQWDHGQVFVAPSLARNANLRRGDSNRQCALYAPQSEMKQISGTDIYLTNDSIDLEPHVDTIAMIDCCELTQGDIHGHESANPLRSPGKTKQSNKPGYLPMFNNERGSNHPQGCEAYYAATPTMAALHSHYAKVVDQNTKVGIAFKGIGRTLHTVYHYGAGLPNGELDRFQSRNELFEHFPDTVEDLNVLAKAEDARALTNILRRIDPAFMAKRKMGQTGIVQHNANVDEAQRLLYVGQPRVVSLPLTNEERAYWSAGVPDQISESPRAQIWEQIAWAFKLVSNDMVRTVALEFDYVDVHDRRTESQVRVQAKQISIPLARLITKLKEAGIYDRTVIAVYTTDGSRSPAANSSGDEGKNTIILAGGMVQGGYYGDVSVAGNEGSDGHVYAYHMPDLETGVRLTNGVTNNSQRVPGSAVWRTVAKALKIPDSYLQFPDVKDARPLPFMLRA